MQFDYDAFRRVICRLRKERQLSQDVFSGFATLSRSHLSMIETGAKEPNLDTAYKIAQALDMPLSELIRLQEEESKKTPKPSES